jgi:plasmid stability protein
MAQFIVRDLEDDVKARLKRRAARHGRSMEKKSPQPRSEAPSERSPCAYRVSASHCQVRFVLQIHNP